MTLPTNIFTQYAAIGNREDLSDVIYDISPTETPFASNIPRVKATAVLHEWQTDSLEAASATNAALEGDDFTGVARTPTTRRGNRCQILTKDIVVSGTQRAVKTAGRSDELEYQVAKAGKELKRDIESALLSVNPATAGSTATARLLGGIETWLATNKINGTTGTTPGAGATVLDASQVTITTASQLKTFIDTLIASCWTAGGNPEIIMVGAAGKQYASRMSGIATLYRDVPAMQQAQIVAGADWYVSDFGQHKIVPNRFMRGTRTVLILDMNYWAIAELRTMRTIPMSKTGDNDKTMLLTELTLEARNEAASAKLADRAFA